MENLTEKAGLVRMPGGLGSDPRCHQVVYREVGQRKLFLFTLPPGTFFRPSLLQRFRRHVVYEVSSERELVHEFSQQFHTHDEKHDFILNFVLIYQVSVPEKLVEGMGRDPLRLLEGAILREIGGQVSRLPWEVIWNGGNELDRELQNLLERGSAAVHDSVQWLNDRSSGWGLVVHRLTVDRALPASATSPFEYSSIAGERKRRTTVAELGDQAFVEKKKGDIESDRQAHQLQQEEDLRELTRAQELRAVDHKGQLLARGTVERLVANLHGILDRAAQQVDNLPQLQRTMVQLHGLKSELFALAAPIGPPSAPALAEGIPALLLPPGSAEADSGIGKVFDELHLYLTTLPVQTHQTLAAPILRILSELFRGETAADEVLAECRHDLEQSLEEHFDLLDDEQVDFIRRMKDVDSLRFRLGLEKSGEAP